MKRQQIQHEIVSLVAQARREGWYEDDPAWEQVDERLRRLESPDGCRTAP